MKTKLQVVILLTSLTFTCQIQAAPAPCPATGHYYEYVGFTGRIGWTNASVDAASRSYMGMKGHLATVTSEAENSFLLSLGIPGDGAWLGGIQIPPDTQEPGLNWTWITGEEWDYDRWNIGEPNDNADTHEFLLAISGTNAPLGYWNDNPGIYAGHESNLEGYFVEYEPAPEFPVLTNQQTAIGYGFDFDGRFAVWRDERLGGGSPQIFARDISLNQEIQVSLDGYNGGCRVSGGTVLWISGSDETTKIMAKDLTGRLFPSNQPPIELLAASGIYSVDIDGDWMVWVEGVMSEVGGNVHAKNLKTSEQIEITSSTATEWHVLISGSNVFYTSTPEYIWGDGPAGRDWDVYRYDISTRTVSPVKVGAGNYEAIAADAQYVLLFEVPEYSLTPPRKLWLKNWLTGAETLITDNALGGGALCGNLVIYEDPADSLVKAYEISSGERYSVSARPGGDPVIANNVVLWYEPNFGSSSAIFGRKLYPRTLGTPSIFAGLNVFGPVGSSYRIECLDSLSNGNWTFLTNLTLTSSPQLWIDMDSAGKTRRFYRAIPQD